MAWDASQDAERYRTAHDLQRRIGVRWLVMWGAGSRAFWAFYCGSATIRPLCAATPDRLLEHIRTAEGRLAAGIEPDQRTVLRGSVRHPRPGC